MQSACAVLYCHPWPVWLCYIFPYYLINGTIFGKKILRIKCPFWFSLQLLSETFLVIKRIQRDIIINVHRCSCKVPLLLSDFNETWIFWTDFREILERQISWKSVQWKSDRRIDRQTDMTKIIVAFRNFSKACKKKKISILFFSNHSCKLQKLEVRISSWKATILTAVS
jgi:hypothetical protein